jgi:hypothetical protein
VPNVPSENDKLIEGYSEEGINNDGRAVEETIEEP